jgi:iron complex transport system substrate-binding protein
MRLSALAWLLSPLRQVFCAALSWAALVAPVQAELLLRDDLGVAQRFEAPPQRIISLLPSLTETVVLLGGGARLVGVDRYSGRAPELAGLPRLGGLDDVSIEAIVRLEPEVVLASTAARGLAPLQALGVRVLRYRSDSHADARRAIEQLALLLGRPERAARQWQRIEQQLDAAAASVPARWRAARVYFAIGEARAAGPASFIGESLKRLGLDNAVPAGWGPFPQLNPEFVVLARPQLLMGAADELQTLAKRPGWRTLAAVRAQHWCAFTPAQMEVLVRPGPRMGEAAQLVAACLQGLAP